ncbi:hypothetical protein [Aquimarina sediminis]|uniref:hypothetical protein n=1 Tax=Aquimarina sediminis TaxID=2070536 RepID=UPI000CA02096|nr:hypothetical protein [Aquimarina sediminis]
MKNSVLFYFILFLFCSCITTHNVRQIDNFRIETENAFNEESFVFKPSMLPEEAKRSLRKQFGLTNDQKLSDFDIKLFSDFESEFNVKISFDVDRTVTMDFVSPIVFDEESENIIGEAETFVKIIVVDSAGDNCLSTKSLFYNKTRSFLIDIKNNIRKEPLF